MKKIKEYFNDLLKLMKDEKLLTCFIFGCLINEIIVRMLTVKNIFSLSPVFGDLIVCFLFSGLYFVIKPKNRFKYIYTLTIIFSIIGIANIVYYSYYDSFISVTFASFAFTNTETGDANVVGNLLRPSYFILLWFPIFMFVFHKNITNNKKLLKSKINDKKIDTLLPKKRCIQINYINFAVSLLLLILGLDLVDYGRFYNQWNREYSVTKFGVYLYQLNDIVTSISPNVAPLFGSDKANKKIDNYYKNKGNTASINKYSNIFKGKNVIAIHAESMQTLAMEANFNGNDVTPNLKKLASDGIFFNNFYSQVSIGTSSDTEFLVANSMMPVKIGTAFINYANRSYNSMYKILNDNGYYTFSMHANTGEFWNRNNMYKSLGYQKFYDKNSFVIDEKIGFGLSDKSFLSQAVKKIKEISLTNTNFYGTIITLSNHTPFEDTDKYGDFPVTLTVDGITYPYLEGTKLGNYFKSAHYADSQIGMFIDMLDKEGILDNTVIIIYGDHDARIEKDEWNYYYNYNYETEEVYDEYDERYKNIDYYWYEINRRVPFIIYSKDEDFKKNYSEVISRVSGMIDISPTILNMLGFNNPYALGSDLFSKNESIVAFPNGNFITDKVYYNDSKNEYKLLEDVPIKEDYIKSCKEYTDEILDISNSIVVYDYFNKDEKYKNENEIGE